MAIFFRTQNLKGKSHMLRIFYSLSLIIFCLSCNRPLIVEKCTVAHPLNHTLHGSVINSDRLNNDTPNDDLHDLEEGVSFRAATYQISLKIGNDQQIDVVADTGSSDLVFSSEYYTPTITSKNLNQSLSLSYGSCNGKAKLYSDNIGLSCGEEVAGEKFALLTGSSGSDSCPNIMGLAYKNLTSTKSSF
ncbi:MAG: pepsin-like aspartyl protease, partial [bacterium]|nr:pepsin-like aspartyl protease [bacterium]